MVPPKYLSVVGAHDWPPSVLLNTPPPTVPIQYSSGRVALPATATERPPRNGPISRHFSAAKARESYVTGPLVAVAADVAAGRACAASGAARQAGSATAASNAAPARGRTERAGTPKVLRKGSRDPRRAGPGGRRRSRGQR